MSDASRILHELVILPAAVAWFSDLFERAHIEVSDTAERFTVTYAGPIPSVAPGFSEDEPNFVVAVTLEELRNLRAVFEDGTVSPDEEYRIVRAMLQPCLKAALDMPILTKDAVRKAVQIDDHWQEALLDPAGNETVPVTAFYVNKQWVVVPGFHGSPKRRLRLTPADALTFQRRLFAADQRNSLPGWLDFARWYTEWREGVTVPGGEGP